MKNTIFIIAIFIITAITSAGVFGFMNAKTNIHKSITLNNVSGETTAEISEVFLTFNFDVKSGKDENIVEKFNQKHHEMLKKIEEIGLDKSAIKTNKYGENETEDGKFQGSNIEITFKKEQFDKILKIVHALAEIEGVTFHNLSKKSDDFNTILELARVDAIQKGRLQAEKLATEMGVTLGKIQYINTGYNNYPNNNEYIYNLGKHTSESEINNFVEKTTYNTDMSLVFEIK